LPAESLAESLEAGSTFQSRSKTRRFSVKTNSNTELLRY